MLTKNNKGDLLLRKTYASPTPLYQYAVNQHLQYTATHIEGHVPLNFVHVTSR